MTIKKIAAIAAATTLVMSITAISASAAVNRDSHSEYVKGHNAICTLEAIVGEHNQVASTYYNFAGNGSTYPEVRTHLHVDDYYTGKLMGENKVTKAGAYPTAKAVVHYCESPISLFSAHEVYPDKSEGWAYYLALCGINNEHEEGH